MAGSSSCPLPSSEPTSSFTSQSESEMEFSKAYHFSELDESATSSNWSAETNYKYFAELQNNPQWSHFFIGTSELEVGQKISHGAQADIYEARLRSFLRHEFDLVVKVMKGDIPLQEFQKQWPIGLLSARSKYKHDAFDMPMNSIMGGTLLEDERLRGRFAFVMSRYWGDLCLLIDRRMKARPSTNGPFSIDQAIHLMLTIAENMYILHTKHNIIHRDLKASNVLVWNSLEYNYSYGDRFQEEVMFEDNEMVIATVADFESSRLVMGTAFWRAPEIFQQLEDGVPSMEVTFTTMSDVYSYGMTCYKIVTGSIPFDPKHEFCKRDEVLSGRRPNLPSEVPLLLRNIIERCWHRDPKERPNFREICVLLKNKQEIPDLLESKQSHPVEQWGHCSTATLLQVIEEFARVELLILRATKLSTGEKSTHYLEVANFQFEKVCDPNIVAYIERALRMRMTNIFNWHGRFAQNDVIKQTYVIEISIQHGSLLFSGFSDAFSKLNLEVHITECRSSNGYLQCAMLVQGRKGWCLDSLLDGLASSNVSCYIVFHKLATGVVDIHLANVKHVLGAPFSPSSTDTCPFEQALNNPSPKYVLLEERNILHHDAIDVLRRVGYCSRSSFIPQRIYTSWLSNRRHKPQHDEDLGKFKGSPLFFRISGGHVLSICLRRRALQWKPWKTQML